VKPDVPVALQKLSLSLLVEIAPTIAAEYPQRSAGVAALMLQIAAEEWDRAAARRAEENAALRALFREALPVVSDRGLREDLEASAGSRDDDLRLTALDAANRELRRRLIALQAHVETREGEAARRVEAAIWAELRRSTERRAVPLAPF
jgi:hypothetical protein